MSGVGECGMAGDGNHMIGMGNHMTVVDNHMTGMDNHMIGIDSHMTVVEQGRSAAADEPDGGLLCFLFAFLPENTAMTS